MQHVLPVTQLRRVTHEPVEIRQTAKAFLKRTGARRLLEAFDQITAQAAVLLEQSPRAGQQVRGRDAILLAVRRENFLRLEKQFPRHEPFNGVVFAHPAVGRIGDPPAFPFDGGAGINQVADINLVFEQVTNFARAPRASGLRLTISPNRLLEGLSEPNRARMENVKKALARKRQPKKPK